MLTTGCQGEANGALGSPEETGSRSSRTARLLAQMAAEANRVLAALPWDDPSPLKMLSTAGTTSCLFQPGLR